MSDVAPNTEYERRTRKLFWLGPWMFGSWRDLHRSRVRQVWSDPSLTSVEQQKVKRLMDRYL